MLLAHSMIVADDSICRLSPCKCPWVIMHLVGHLESDRLNSAACRSVQSKGLKQLPIHLFESIVLKAMPAQPCQVKCIQIASTKT